MDRTRHNLYLETDDSLVRICWYYYKMRMPMTKIAEKMNTNRIKISQLIDKAIDKGIMELRIKSSSVELLSIGNDLKNKYDLNNAIVVPFDETANLPEQLGIAAAQYLGDIVSDGDVFGIGWGTAVSKTISNLNLSNYNNVKLVSLAGGISSLITLESNNAKFFKFIPSPMKVKSEELAQAIREEKEVKVIMDLIGKAKYALVGIGAPNIEATFFKKKYISNKDIEELKKRGAVGDILGQFFDKHGKRVEYQTDNLLIATDINKLCDMFSIAVSGGPLKVDAIHAALKRGYIKVIVTDELTAAELLEF